MTPQGCFSIPQRRNLPFSGMSKALVPGFENGLFARSGQPVGTVLDRGRPLSVVAQGQAGNPKYGGLFLNSAGIGQHYGAICLQAEEVEIAQGLHDMDLAGKWDCALSSAGEDSGMHRPIQRDMARDHRKRSEERRVGKDRRDRWVSNI